MGEGDSAWVRFSILDILAVLDQRFGDLGSQAAQFYSRYVSPASDEGVRVCPASGDNFTTTSVFEDRRVLALHLYFDAVVTSRNALGRAAVATRKFYVISFRVSNAPTTMRDSNCLLPIAIVPPGAWAQYGFDGIINLLKEEFDCLAAGTLILSHVSHVYAHD